MLRDHATGRLDLAQGCFVRNLDAEEALDRPLFVRSRVQQVDPYRILRAIGDVGGGDALAVDLQHGPVRVRLQMSGLGARRHQRFTPQAEAALWSPCPFGMGGPSRGASASRYS